MIKKINLFLDLLNSNNQRNVTMFRDSILLNEARLIFDNAYFRAHNDIKNEKKFEIYFNKNKEITWRSYEDFTNIRFTCRS